MASELIDDCDHLECPVPCTSCGKWIDLHDANFGTYFCGCHGSCSHGVCNDCNDSWAEEAEAVEASEYVDKAPLFIPLKREYYEKFQRREKDTEYRAYGKRWNEFTCDIGRKAILSLGYGKQSRMSGIIMSAKLVPQTSDFIKIYGDKEKCFAIRFCKLEAI